jgi:hypothetical protein
MYLNSSMFVRNKLLIVPSSLLFHTRSGGPELRVQPTEHHHCHHHRGRLPQHGLRGRGSLLLQDQEEPVDQAQAGKQSPHHRSLDFPKLVYTDKKKHAVFLIY